MRRYEYRLIYKRMRGQWHMITFERKTDALAWYEQYRTLKDLDIIYLSEHLIETLPDGRTSDKFVDNLGGWKSRRMLAFPYLSHS